MEGSLSQRPVMADRRQVLGDQWCQLTEESADNSNQGVCFLRTKPTKKGRQMPAPLRYLDCLLEKILHFVHPPLGLWAVLQIGQ